MKLTQALEANGKAVMYGMLPSFVALVEGVPMWHSYSGVPVLLLDTFELSSCSWRSRNRFHERITVAYAVKIRARRRREREVKNTSPAVLFRTREYARPHTQRTGRGHRVSLFQDLDLVAFNEFKSLAKSRVRDITQGGIET